MRIKKYFHINSFTLSLVMKQRLGTTCKWPIDVWKNMATHHNFKGCLSLVSSVIKMSTPLHHSAAEQQARTT